MHGQRSMSCYRLVYGRTMYVYNSAELENPMSVRHGFVYVFHLSVRDSTTSLSLLDVLRGQQYGSTQLIDL